MFLFLRRSVGIEGGDRKEAEVSSQLHYIAWAISYRELNIRTVFISRKQRQDKVGVQWGETTWKGTSSKGLKLFQTTMKSAEPWPTAQWALILSSSETSSPLPPKHSINKLFWKTSKLFEKVHYGILYLYAKWLFNKITSLNFSHE